MPGNGDSYKNIRLPNFFIVGAPRCGTTALYTYLRQHPDIFLPATKEPHYFNRDMNSGGAVRDEKEYLSLFGGAQGQARVGEASVYYLSSASAPREISESCPGAKIIVMLRNPVDVMYALHALHVVAWLEDVWDFEKALELEEERRRGLHLPPWTRDTHKLFYRETVSFARQVKNYRGVFGAGNVHVIIYDDFKRDTAQAFRETCLFLGVDPSIRLEFPVIWANPAFRSQALANLVHRPPKFLRSLARVMLPRRLRAGIVQSLWVWNRTRAPRPPMRAELRRRLTAELAPQVKELSVLLGLDLSYWSQCP